MAEVRKQFDTIPREECLTHVDNVVDCFIPEMSLDVKEILSQFSFVDNVRLSDLMKQGYSSADDDSDFDKPDWDSLDIAEKEELFKQSVEIINRYKAEQTPDPQEDPQPDADA